METSNILGRNDLFTDSDPINLSPAGHAELSSRELGDLYQSQLHF